MPTTVGDAELCPSCVIQQVLADHIDTDWIENRFPQLIDPVGRGIVSQRVVEFDARDFESGTPVSVYIVDPGPHLDRLLSEVEKRAHLEHQRIATLLDHGEIDGKIYAIEVRPPGTLLADSIRNEGLGRREFLGHIPSITAAIEYAAEGGIVLGGSPEGIYIAEDGTATLAGIPTSIPSDEKIDPLQWVKEHPTIGTRIGNYQLLELLGEGGFAEVYRALQNRPVRREVALKILKLGMDTRQLLARFARERQALAQLEHGGIARIYDAGATGAGRPFIVMELIDGAAITTHCEESLAPLEQRSSLMASVCRAVAHAHSREIIHRDLKPSNILVMDTEEGAFPKVIDFGIARAAEEPLDSNTFFTRTQQLVGSPAYMSPEQTSGKGDLDARSDVYSLGCLLYELLVGEAPLPEKEITESSLTDVLRRIQTQPAEHPADRFAALSLDRRIRAARQRATSLPDLKRTLTKRGPSEIALKALATDPADRYQTADAMASDLEAWTTRETITAPRRRRRAVHRAKRAVRLVALIAIACSAIWYLNPLRRKPAISRSVDGTLQPVALFQFNGSLESAIPDGPDMIATGNPELAYESATIGGSEAQVLHFQRMKPSQWLKCKNTIGVNGPAIATETNRWTIVLDVMFPEFTGPTALFQCHSENFGDAELYVGPRGIGSRFDLYYGGIQPGEWNRIAVSSFDNGRAQLYAIYVNGTRWGIPWVKGMHSAGYAFCDEFLFFCEGDQKTGEGLVNSLAIYDVPLTDAEIRALGPPTAEGIPPTLNPGPAPIPENTLLASTRIALDGSRPRDLLGKTIAMGPDEVWVAATRSSIKARDGGAVFRYKLEEDGSWTQLDPPPLPANLTPSAKFGHSIALSANHAVVGAPSYYGGGAAFLYRRASGDASWSAPKRLAIENGSTGLGGSVAIIGDTIVVTERGAAITHLFTLEDGRHFQTIQDYGFTVSASRESFLLTAEDGTIGIFRPVDENSRQWTCTRTIPPALRVENNPPPTPDDPSNRPAIAISPDGRWIASSDKRLDEVQLFHRGENGQWAAHSQLPRAAETLTFTSAHRLLAGNPRAAFNQQRLGEVRIYDHSSASPNAKADPHATWIHRRTIRPRTASHRASFGETIAGNSIHAWIGAPTDHTDQQHGGAVYPVLLPQFETQRFETLAPHFTRGSHVAIHGKNAAVASPGIDNRVHGGQLQTFRRTDGVWQREFQTPEADLTQLPNAAHSFVTLLGDTLATNIGNQWHLIHRQPNGQWIRGAATASAYFRSPSLFEGGLLGSLNQTTLTPIVDRRFGAPQSLSEDLYYRAIPVSTHLDRALLPRKDGTLALHEISAAGLRELAILQPPNNLAPAARFAQENIDLSSTHAIIGAPTRTPQDIGTSTGQAFIYNLENPDAPPVFLASPEPDPETMTTHGWAVAIDGNIALLGNPFVHQGQSPGRVYVYRRNEKTETWQHTGTLQASNAQGGDLFGHFVDLDDGWAIIGAASNWVYFFKLQ